MALSQVQTSREKFLLSVSRVLLVVTFIELCCWICEVLSGSGMSALKFWSTLVGLLFGMFVCVPCLVAATIVTLCIGVKGTHINIQEEYKKREQVLCIGIYVAILAAIVTAAIFGFTKIFELLVLVAGMPLVVLLVSNIIYLKKVKN